MLCSLENLLGYQILATNGPIGTVADFLLLDGPWRVCYLAVTAGGWLDRRKVLLSAGDVRQVNHARKQVHVRLTRELVYGSPSVGDGDHPALHSFREMTTLSTKVEGKHNFVIDVIARTSSWSVESVVVSESRRSGEKSLLIPTRRIRKVEWASRLLWIPRRPDDEPFLPFDGRSPVNARKVVRRIDYLGILYDVTVLPDAEERG